MGIDFRVPVPWQYSALNALDYFQAAGRYDGQPPDPRLAEAVELVRAAREPDGAWRQGYHHPGEAWFEVDAPWESRRKWLTLHALRALAWWDGAGNEGAA